MPTVSNSVRIAGFILLAILAYFVFRGLTREEPATADAETQSVAERETTPPIVSVRDVFAQPHQITLNLKGQTEPDRRVTVRSETVGTVTSADVQQGQVVKKGTLLCGLGVESRAAQIAQAEAAVRAATLEHDAALALEQKGWTTSNRAAATKASLDQALAILETAKIELTKTKLRAPFSGIFETRLAERGAFLSMGSACGEIVDLDPIIVAIEVTEPQMRSIDRSANVRVNLPGQETVSGKVRFVARSANPQTRTFKVEIEVPNPDYELAAGMTASVDINLGSSPAVQLSPASLVLHDDGRVGVRYVDADNLVQFNAVTVIDDGNEGIWVSGIPDGSRLLAAGQDYLKEGTRVSIEASGSLQQ